MFSLKKIIKQSLHSKINDKGISNFLPKFDKNKKLQSDIWSEKTYKVNPKTHVFTTIQERFGNRLINNVVLPKDSVVLDIGCFIGEKLWQLPKDQNYFGVGVDIAISSLAAAKKIDIYNHEFIAADLEDLPFKDNSIDFVMIFDVIEHLSDAEKGFSEVSRILTKGGQFLLHIPIIDNQFSLFWFKQKLFPKLAMKDYLDVGHSKDRMLSSTQIKEYLNKYNLELKKEIYFNSFMVHLFDRELSSLIGHFLTKSHKGVVNQSRVVHQGNLGKTRSFYGKYIVPILEFLSFPDLLLSKLKIGNTYFVLATKKQ